MVDSGELARIKGIGPATVAWLTSTFGVRNAADLAALDPDEIERRLTAMRRPKVSRADIESWVTEARTRVETPEEEVNDRVSFASFVVEFQAPAGGGAPDRTSVHHLELDHTQSWDGVDCERLGAWIAARLPKPAAPAAVPRPAEPVPEPVPEPPEVPVAQEITGRAGSDAGGAHVVVTWSTGEQDLPDGEWLLDVLVAPIGARAHAPSGTRSVRVPPGPDHRYEVRVPITGTDAPVRATALLRFHRSGSARALLAGSTDLGIIAPW